jgi:hypothetical protein
MDLLGSGTADGGAGDDRIRFEQVRQVGVALPVGVVTVGIGGAGTDSFGLLRSVAPDTVDAGPGNDRIDARSAAGGPPDVVDCGAGRDEYLADVGDQVTAARYPCRYR